MPTNGFVTSGIVETGGQGGDFGNGKRQNKEEGRTSIAQNTRNYFCETNERLCSFESRATTQVTKMWRRQRKTKKFWRKY